MKWLFLLLLLPAFLTEEKGDSTYAQLRQGDLVFQNLTCGELCQAILAVTPCQDGKTFNHCGIVSFTDSGIFVIEAIGEKVQQTPLPVFVSRNEHPVAFARLRGKEEVARAAVARARHYLGRPYDPAFLPGDSALYCSELVWECYQENGQKIFELQPMTFKAPGTDSTFGGWKSYYQQLGMPVPEGVPGINPCGIANERFLEWL